MAEVRLAIFQCDCAGLRAAERLERLDEAAAAAASDILLCPELFSCGYGAKDRWRAEAEPQDGAVARAVSTIARRRRIAIVYGYPEAASAAAGPQVAGAGAEPARDARLYNAAAAYDAEGALAGHHRKLTAPPLAEREVFARGDALRLFRLCGLRCALLICYDFELPETVRAAALAGAEAILVPTALTEEWGVVAEAVAPARAFENGVFLAYANHAGAESGLRYFGGSRILGPDGSALAVAGDGPEVISAALDPRSLAAARERLPYLADSAELIGRLEVTAPDARGPADQNREGT